MGYRLLLLALLGATLAYLALARRIPLDAWSAAELVNSRTLPTIYAIVLTLALIALMVRPPPHAPRPRHGGRALMLLAIAVAFVWLVPRAGIWIALAVLLAGALLAMGERRPTLVAGLGAGIPAAGWFAVERMLGIYVPGPWS